MSISLFATWKGYSHPAVVMALSKQQVSNLRNELRENRTVNNAVTLSAEKRSAKIAKLQQYLDTVPKGARKTSLQKELEKFKSFTGLIAASEQEEQSTRGHVTAAVKDAKDALIQRDIQPPFPEQLPTPTPVPVSTDAQPTLADRNPVGISVPLEPLQKKKQKVAHSSLEQALAHLKIF